MDKKQKHKKPKKGPKSAPQKHDDEDNKMEKDDTEQNQNLLKQVNINNNINQDSEGKKSYSSVIKSSLQSSAASEHKKEPSASSKSDKAKVARKDRSKEEKENLRSQQEKKVSIEKSDSWENIPASVTQQEDSWERTSKKGKKRNKSKSEDKKEKVTFEKEDDIIPEEPKVLEKVQDRQKSPEKTVQVVTEADAEAAARDDEADSEMERRKIKKKKKKADSGEPEDIFNAHKVLICDDQVKV